MQKRALGSQEDGGARLFRLLEDGAMFDQGSEYRFETETMKDAVAETLEDTKERFYSYDVFGEFVVYIKFNGTIINPCK